MSSLEKKKFCIRKEKLRKYHYLRADGKRDLK